jgi:hypothetical protein
MEQAGEMLGVSAATICRRTQAAEWQRDGLQSYGCDLGKRAGNLVRSESQILSQMERVPPLALGLNTFAASLAAISKNV